MTTFDEKIHENQCSENVLKRIEIAEKIRRFAAKTAEKVLKKISAASRRKLLKKC